MKILFQNPKSLFIAVLVFIVGRAATAFANPTGLSVATGNASAQQIGAQLNVAVGQMAILNWQSFNIQKGETTSFIQPSSSSIVFNVIGGANPSQIFGNLNANGTVILANANGFYFGPNSMIKVGGSFIATTAPLPPDFGSGAAWQFTGTPPLASIVNYGQIEVGTGKSLYLIAEKIENHGSLTAPGGDAELLAGDNVLVSERADGRGLSATVQMPEGSVDNFGRITADAGTIALQAKVVNQNGILQADSFAEKNGTIELVASDSLNLGADSQILARGDDSVGGSAGGKVTLKSGNVFSDAEGGQIVTTGGDQGGNGGDIEVSAPNIQSLNSAMNAGAQAGFNGGEFLLDPVNIILGTSGGGTVPANGTVLATDNGNGADGNGTLNLNVNTAFKNKNFSKILLQATGNIYLGNGSIAGGIFTFSSSPATVWDLSTTTGQAAGQLTLQAKGDIIFGNGSKFTDAKNWSVTLDAGYDFANNSIIDGTGNIYLNGGSGKTGSGTIQLAGGSVNLFAGQSILAGSGSVYTTGGGNIFAYALKGDINTGTFNGGTSSTRQTSNYSFTDDGATPNAVLGGFSTANGGDVTLIAGGNITSIPKIVSSQAPGASGTYGDGDVTVIAGKQITGNYNLADGTGTMLAGVKVQAAQADILQNPEADPAAYAAMLSALKTAVMQSHNVDGNIGAGAPVTFSLINGSWNVWAANNLYVKEVNNPNGAFNYVNSAQQFLYNYAPDAAAHFWAGNAIELTGDDLKRLSSENLTPIYAPILSLNAGAGGIKIDKAIILAPGVEMDSVHNVLQSQGSLSLITRDGGNLTSTVVDGTTSLNGIIMSDSDLADYATYASTHAATPLHLYDANPAPVFLDIDGSIGNFSLNVPTFADITVRGNKPFAAPDGDVSGTYNFGFVGRNLSVDHTTSIDVHGVIRYRGDLSDIDLTDAEKNDLLPAILFADSANTAITGKLRYDATTGKLIYVGVMTTDELNFLLSPALLVRDQNGSPILQIAVDSDGNEIPDANGNPTFVPVTKPLVLDDTQKGMINDLFTASQTASLGDQGLTVSGPGKFKVTANSIDLGVSAGILVAAPDAVLAGLSPYGAALTVKTTVGNLSMTSTKIANESYLGSVNVDVAGALDVGGQFTGFDTASTPKGIYTTSGGDVNVTAHGDVNVNGSRIAAYNGGNVTVESLHGDVNAGTGGAGYVSLNALELDPGTGSLNSIPASIPGSGILATTVFGSHAALGNITIKAPEGSLNASLGGIIQIGFNGTDTHDKFIDADVANDINANGSGIIGSNIRLHAGGDINGVVIGSQSINIQSQHNVDVTAVSGGSVNIGAAGSVAGTIVGGGDVSVSGDAISAAVEGGSVSTSGDTSGASLGVPASNVAKDVAEAADNANAAGKTGADESDDELLKKKKGISLAQKVSRVTVLLPPKN